MTDPLLPVDDARALTPEEVIEFCLELCREAGAIGFDEGWGPEHTVELISINPDFLNLSPAKQALRSTINIFDVIAENTMRLEREKSIERLLQNNLPVVRKALAIVNQKLLAAGWSRGTLDDNKKVRLLCKVRILHDLEHPKPKPAERAQLYLRRHGQQKMQKIQLPMKAPFWEIRDILHDLSCVVGLKGDPVHHGHGTWMYKFLTKDGIALDSCQQLSVDADYQDLVKQVTKSDSATPSAVLYQVCIGVPRSVSHLVRLILPIRNHLSWASRL